MLRNIQAVLTKALQRSTVNFDQKRSTYIFRRKNEPDFKKINMTRRLKKKHYYYTLLEHTHWRKQPEVDLILLKNVEGVGNSGDVVKIPRLKAYEYFILTGAATFATPENLKKHAILKKEDAIPIDIQNTLKKLSMVHVPVIMHKTNPWTIKQWHVKLALRKIGIMCSEESIQLPKNEISGPDMNLEKMDFIIHLTVNNKYSVPMRCRLFQMSLTESAASLIINPKFYLEPIRAIFPEEQDKLEKIPLPKQDRKGGIVILDN